MKNTMFGLCAKLWHRHLSEKAAFELLPPNWNQTMLPVPVVLDQFPAGQQPLEIKREREPLKILEKLRDGETTIKTGIFAFEGGGTGGGEENRPKTLFFLGNIMTIRF